MNALVEAAQVQRLLDVYEECWTESNRPLLVGKMKKLRKELECLRESSATYRQTGCPPVSNG